MRVARAMAALVTFLMMSPAAGLPPPGQAVSSAAAGDIIAFTSEQTGGGDIYTMNSDGSDLRRLTSDAAYDGGPSWSPDGQQIAFLSNRNGNSDIYVMDADGADLRQLTSNASHDNWPAWSPDGTKIAFTSNRDGNFEIYVIDADGSDLQRLTATDGWEDFPAWSPDGSQIAYSRIFGDDGTFVMNADGSGESRLLTFTALEIDWSPDGAELAFGSDHAGFRGIYVLELDGGALRCLTTARSGENGPDWSPDGSQLVFATWHDGDGEIYLMDSDGGNRSRLTSNGSHDEFPAWRPSGGASGAMGDVPKHTEWLAAAPNPFNPLIRVRYGVARDGPVRVLVRDVEGSLVRTLVAGEREAGIHATAWNGRDLQGRPAPSGVYLVQMTTSERSLAEKISLVR